MKHDDVTAGILVGGRGRRAGGRDKALTRRADGGTFLEHIHGELVRRVREVVLLGRADQHYDVARLLHDRRPDCGPLAGLETLLGAMTTPRGLLVACDLGSFNGALLDLLAATSGSLVVPRTGERHHWTAALYARELGPLVTTSLEANERALHRFAATVGFEPVEVPAALSGCLANHNR